MVEKRRKKKKAILSKESKIKNLLQSQNVINSTGISNEETSINFFIGSLSKSESESISSAHEKEEHEEQEDEVESPRPVSSYIQMEDFTNTLQQYRRVKINFNDELLYKPTCEEIAHIKNDDIAPIRKYELHESASYFQKLPEITAIKADANMIRMINRFYEEGNLNVLASATLLKNQIAFLPPKTLYKSSNDFELKLFKPIFYSIPLSQFQQYLTISKKIISLTLKELKFIEHPLAGLEHRLENKLENLYYAYLDKVQQNHITKITFELTNIREIVKNFMKNTKEEDFDKIQYYINQIKCLRHKLHREELALKTLVKNSLDTWIELKNCRKKQGFNYTDFKLTIKLDDAIDDIGEDERLWNERFQLEFSEILREEFENYYKEKRFRKQNLDVNLLKPLKKPDTETIKNNVNEILKNCTRLPGEPKIILGHDKMDDRCKNLEKFRDYFFRIIFDNEYVGETKNLKLDSDFKIKINQSFGVYLENKMPKEIRIEVFEKSKLALAQKIAKILIPIDLTKNYTAALTETIEFASEKQNMAGKLIVILNEKSTNSEEYPKSNRPRTAISKDTLKNWYDSRLINPLDPDYLSQDILYNDDKDELNVANNENQKKKTFSLNEDCILAFCSKDEIDNNQRFNMLRARYNKDMKYKDFKFIPLFENEFVEENENEEKILNEDDWMDPIDLHKYKGKKYLRKLYDVIVNHSMKLNKDEDSSNLLIGNDPPTIRSIIESIIGLFGPSRPFSPPKTRQITLSSNNPQSFNIVVNVVRATGIPVRNFSQHSSGRRNSNASIMNEQNLKYGNVRPYVCVNYKDKFVRTMTADGSNPTFNQQLVIQISGNIAEAKDELKVQIFDEYIEDLLNGDHTRSMEVYQRIHANFLGEYRIPMTTIFTKQRIEGVFEMNISKLLIGYIKPSLDHAESSMTIETYLPEIRESVYLWLYISIEPQFDIPHVKMNSLECSELKEVKVHISERCIQIKELQPKRFLDPMCSLETGKRVCLTRLLESIPLPFENNNDESLIRRYVSLFPIIKSSSSCVGLKGVWLNNQTILDTTWASAKDLGVLLTCFYMSLGIRSWLVLGVAYPYGEVAYVLILEDLNYILIDPCSGKKYHSRDVNCPLQIVQYIVGQDNIYCNLQRENRVSMTDFNFNDSSLWMPIFGKNNPAPIGGVHKLNYNYMNLYNINDLRKSIERKIMKKISSWRSTRKTIWNRAFSSTLYDILIELEQDVIYERVPGNYLERLSREFSNFKLFGFTLNFSYTNLSAISDKIKLTGIHMNTDKTVEFSVAVYIHQYPNNILSCWVFILTATPCI